MNKLAVFDIDGTIAKHGNVPQSVLDGIQSLQSNGYITTVSTGRNYGMVKHAFGENFKKIISKNALLIVEHGTRICDYDGKVMFAEYFNDDELEHISDFIRTNIEIVHHVLLSPSNTKEITKAWCPKPEYYEAVKSRRGEYSEVTHFSIGKFNEVLKEDKRSWIMIKMLPFLKIENLQLKLTRSQTILNFQDGNMDFMKNNTNKALALSFVKNHLVVESKNVLVAGNAVNDKEMLNEDESTRILVGPDTMREVVKGYIFKPANVIEIDTPEDLGHFLQSIK